MADEIDQANEQAERWLNQALASRSAGPKLAPRGNCHYCETVFDKSEPDFDKKLFCDKDCAHDYEEEQRLRNRR
jgi:hypothetical protein